AVAPCAVQQDARGKIGTGEDCGVTITFPLPAEGGSRGWLFLTSRRHAQLAFDLRERARDGGFALLRAEGQAFRAHDFHVADADEAEHVAQVGLLEVDGGSRAFAVDTTARRGDDHALGPSQSFRAILGVAEGLARNLDAIDPRLELC